MTMAGRPISEGIATVPAAVYEATRTLFRVHGPEDASRLAVRLVSDLGGSIGQDFSAGGIDVSFGQGHPLFAQSVAGSPAQQLIAEYLPAFVEDASHVLEGRNFVKRLARDAGVDALTGLADRAAMGRLMARLDDGDLIVVLDLDGFAKINEEDGRDAGDSVLRSFARALRQSTRANESCSRMGSDEFLIILYQAPANTASAFLNRLNKRWLRISASFPSFSAGFASVSGEGWRSALVAAERALNRAKKAGPGAWECAELDDFAVT